MTASASGQRHPCKVLTVAETFFHDHRNGLARVAWDVCCGLARRGHEVTLVAPAPVTAMESQVVDGVRVVRFPQPQVSGFNPWNPCRRIDAYARALEELAALSWDAVHCHGVYGATAAARVVRRRGRLVVTAHSPVVDEQRWNWLHGRPWERLKLLGLPILRRIEAEALGAADVCTSLSAFTRDRICELYPLLADKQWFVIPHWVGLAWRRSLTVREARLRLGWNPDERVVLAVRQLRARYGLDTAIKAMAVIAKQEMSRLRIVGQGESRADLERLVTRLNLHGCVSFEGGLPDADLKLCYQAADVCVVPSRALECFGIPAIEALGFGVPVVATAVGGLREILGPLTPRLVVPPDDPAALAVAVLSTLRGTAQIPPVNVRLQYVEERFSEETLVPLYEQAVDPCGGLRASAFRVGDSRTPLNSER